MSPNRLPSPVVDYCCTKGSLSDTSPTTTTDNRPCDNNGAPALERTRMQEKFENWKKTNKIITHIRENPFNLHMDCLEQLDETVKTEDGDKKNECDDDCDPSLPTQEVEVNLSETEVPSSKTPIRHEQIQSYATHLIQLYKKNQAIMDRNSDFRTLLYNIICCLLTQEEHILATPSVTKMIDVIRTHLESASKFYSTATTSSSNNNNNNNNINNNADSIATTNKGQWPVVSGQTQASNGASDLLGDRKNSCGTMNLSDSNSSCSFNTSSSSAGPLKGAHDDKDTGSSSSNYLHPHCSYEARRPKPADFRRISSVSYNDEQLINDLCDSCPTGHQDSSSLSGNNGSNFRQESPWKYDELSSECKHNASQHYTSQSSLENNSSSTMDLMHDSGIGTAYDPQFDEFLMRNNMRGVNRKRHSDLNDFKPKQQPSYISTDDYDISQLPDESKTTSFYDDESHSTLHNQKRDFNADNRPVDVASRRAELEWTLNKLINFELKYTWLTGNDTLRRAIRKIGVPNEIRGKVWIILIEQMIGTKYEASELLDKAKSTIAEEETLADDEELQSILKQIDLDVNRTMPGHKLFDDGAEGGIKLRRILVAYSIHINRAIAYCQGFNFIVALLLSVFEGDEEKALRGFVCIVDHIFPSKFYFDHYLTGARADQFLLADFICDQLIKNPTTAERKMVEGVTSSITLNWFISLFHGAVPTLTRLTILDHFMLEGVKALFRFTMAILYLAFQVTPPSSCDVFTTIRNTAKDMYDIKLLLSIVEQIKLPKDSYFAIRRSFYMVQSSFNSDQFYMQSLSNDTSRQLVSNKPLSVQHMPDTKPPAVSHILGASFSQHPYGSTSGNYTQSFNNSSHNRCHNGPRVCTSADRTKVCIQNIGKLGRSHIKIMDANDRSNERSLMSPLRNCLVIGISNCGKNIIVARQSSKRNFKTFREQDLLFSVHELCAEIFDGFYLEACKLASIVTHNGEIFKIDTSKCADRQEGSTETLTLRDSHSIGENEKLKLRLASIDALTNLLWIYVECEDTSLNTVSISSNKDRKSVESLENPLSPTALYRNNPFMLDEDDRTQFGHDSQCRSNHVRKILIIDIITFDIFSAFTLHQSFGEIMSMRTSLVAFCQLANPMSNQFSYRIVRIGPTGRYEHLLSFSDVVDFMISVPEPNQVNRMDNDNNQEKKATQRYSSIRRLLPRSISLNYDNVIDKSSQNTSANQGKSDDLTPGTLTKYYRSLMRRHSAVNDNLEQSYDREKYSSAHLNPMEEEIDNKHDENGLNDMPNSNLPCNNSSSKRVEDRPSRAIITSYLGDVEDASDSNYTPVNMVFIFRNGKIALFEFTESYTIHTRESQLDRYDYAKVIEVIKNGEDFVITILTIFDKLIKVVI